MVEGRTTDAPRPGFAYGLVPVQVCFVMPRRLNAGVLHDSTLLVNVASAWFMSWRRRPALYVLPRSTARSYLDCHAHSTE